MNPHAPFPQDWPARPKEMGGDPFLALCGGNKTSFWEWEEPRGSFEIPGMGTAFYQKIWYRVPAPENIGTGYRIIFAGVGIGPDSRECDTPEKAIAEALKEYASEESRAGFFAALEDLARRKRNKTFPPYGRVKGED